MIGSTNSIWDINSKCEQLVNYTMLYDGSLGDLELNECKALTGGWSNENYIFYEKTPLLATKNTDSIYVNYPSSGTMAMAGTVNMIDLTNYSTFGAVGMSTSARSTYGIRSFAIKSRDVRSTNYGGVSFRDVNVKKIAAIDISSLEGSYYIAMTTDESTYYKGYFYNVFLTKVDNWETLAEKIGITATSIENVLTNSDILLSNVDAVEFMIKQCTGDFMASAIRSSAFLLALNNSPYKTKILANEHWAKFLSFGA